MRLFIIGNGFDLDQYLPTAYSDFRNYLIDEYGENSNFLLYPNIDTMPDGNEVSDIKTDANILTYLCDCHCDNSRNLWSDFEDALGRFSYDEIFNAEKLNDDDDEVYRQLNSYEMRARDYKKSFRNVSTLFTEWIENAIDYDKLNPSHVYSKLFKNNDLFLTFNYTVVLEKIYKIPESNICHIHGKINEELIFGHNGDKEPSLKLDTAEAYGCAFDIHNSLRKDAKKCISKNSTFLNKLKGVDDIYFIGWGMGNSDDVYVELLKEIFKNKTITVHFTKRDFNNNKINYFKKRLNGLNYKIGGYFDIVNNK